MVAWVHTIRVLVDEYYPEAEQIVMVLDNLNTHTIGSLYAAFPPAEAARLARTLEIHYTPKRGSWLTLYARTSMLSPMEEKQLIWVGSSLKDLRGFPAEVRGSIGHALYLAQTGDKHPDAKPLQSFGGAGVLEVVDDFDGDTYRAVYTVRFCECVYVLHAFQKKSTSGIKTSNRDRELISARLRRAEQLHRKE